MKNIIRITLLLIGLALAQNSIAQGDPSMDPSRREEMKKKNEALKAKLNLSAPQAAKYDEIIKRSRDLAMGKMMALPEDAPRSERGAIMRQAMEAADQEIMEILDSDQQAIFKAEKAKMLEERKQQKKNW